MLVPAPTTGTAIPSRSLPDWLGVVPDAALALAFLTIGLVLAFFVLRREDFPFPRAALLFSLFMLALAALGLTDTLAASATPLWLGALLRGVAAALGVLSAATVCMLLPKLLALPSRASLEQSNDRLTKEVVTRTRLEREMHELNHTLEYRVRQRTSQLEKLNEELRLESVERRHAEEETRSLNLNLEQRVADRTGELRMANQQLEAFSHSIVHDLRAPLSTIDGLSGALLKDFGMELPEAGQRSLQQIRAGSRRMAQLIESMLELSRLSRIELVRKRVDMSGLAQAVMDQIALENPRNGVEIRIQDGLVADTDLTLMRVLLQNLLGNAWKFTSRTPAARIEFGTLAKADGGETTWFVRDNGAGFDLQHAQKLFGVFQRFHAEAQFPGSGMGLATARRIVVKHGGRIWAESRPEKGATFYFTL